MTPRRWLGVPLLFGLTAIAALVSACSGASQQDDRVNALGNNGVAIITHPSPRTARTTPAGYDPQPLWSARFLDTPRRVPGGFVGITATGIEDQHVTIQVVNDNGSPRFGVRSQPICSAYVVTRTRAGTELLVTVRTTGVGTATRYWATARNLSNANIAWGPVDSGGPWIGPGLVYGPHTTSTIGAAVPGTKSVALDADTGARVASATPNDLVLAEDNGITLIGHRSAGRTHVQTIDAVSQRESNVRWSSKSIQRPAQVEATAHPRLVGVSAGLAVLQWQPPPGSRGTRTGLYDNNTGRMLYDLGAFAAGRGPLRDPATGEMIIPGVTTKTGARLLVAGRIRQLSASRLHLETPQLLVAGTLFVGDPNTQVSWALKASDPSEAIGGPWASPTAGTATSILDARSDELYDLLVRHT